MHRITTLLHELRLVAFVLAVAGIAVVVSERVYWFWTTDPVSHIELSLYYGVAVAAALWAMARYRVQLGWSLLLATPIFAYVVEGVITPVLYSGGPFVPFFPAYFALWHGVLALAVLVFWVRKWLLAGAWRPLLATSVGYGLLWAVWASVQRLPENVNDADLLAEMDELVVLEPAAFARYAVTFTVILIVLHYALGWLWPERFDPNRLFAQVIGVLCVLGAGLWTVGVPWALPMLLGYLWVQRWGLRRHLAADTGPDVFTQLVGRVPLRVLWPLAAMAPIAAAGYWMLWVLDPSETTLQVTMYSIVVGQASIGGWLTVAALRRAGRSSLSCHPKALSAVS